MIDLTFRLKKILFTLFAVVGIFSFSGLAIGSPYRILKTESIELLFSKKKKNTRVFNFEQLSKSPVNPFFKTENFKHLISQKDQLDKIEFIRFSEKEIPLCFYIKKILNPYASKSLEDFPFSSIQG